MENHRILCEIKYQEMQRNTYTDRDRDNEMNVNEMWDIDLWNASFPSKPNTMFYLHTVCVEYAKPQPSNQIDSVD